MQSYIEGLISWCKRWHRMAKMVTQVAGLDRDKTMQTIFSGLRSVLKHTRNRAKQFLINQSFNLKKGSSLFKHFYEKNKKKKEKDLTARKGGCFNMLGGGMI